MKKLSISQVRKKNWKIGDGELSEHWFSFDNKGKNADLYWIADTWTQSNPLVTIYMYIPFGRRGCGTTCIKLGKLKLDANDYAKNGFFWLYVTNGKPIPFYAFN